ncbi:MAG: AAA family ATPase [Spirochaetales bacterium]|nr:AAA family ATPase [Spirochaetales bacterium]
MALGDARGFLEQFGSEQVILEEAQHVPGLFSYIQGIVDRRDLPGQFILTGSHNFLFLGRISQSLAGRCAIAHLLFFSRRGLLGRDSPDPSQLANRSVSALRAANGSSDTLFGTIFAGGYT